jgi:hypothetical protein
VPGEATVRGRGRDHGAGDGPFGSRDRVLLPGVARGRDQLPDPTRWVTLPGRGHLAMFDEPGPWSSCCSPPPTRQPPVVWAIPSASKHAFFDHDLEAIAQRVALILDGRQRNLRKAVTVAPPAAAAWSDCGTSAPFPGARSGAHAG